MNDGPVIKVKDVIVSINGLVVLEWEAIPAQSYRLQCQTNLTDEWTDLAPDMVAGGKFVRSTNALSPAGQRFFRVRRVN